MHAVRRGCLLLQMSPVPWSVCVFSTQVSCAIMAELIEILFGGLTRMGPGNHVLDDGLDPRMGRTIFKRACRPIVTYLRVSALHPPRANVPAQHTHSGWVHSPPRVVA